MNKWHNVVIDDCCDILDHLRVPVNGQDRQNMKGDIPYYGANGLQGYINDFIFNEDLILIAEDGGNFEEYDTRPIAYKISGKSWVNNHAHILKAKPEYCQDYIFYALVNKNIVRFIAGGTRSKLNKSELIKIPIYCPQNPVEQQKIAKILSTTDTVIEKTQAAITKYKAIKQGMLNDLFTRGIDIKTGKLRPKQEDAPDLYKESKLGWIPKEWNEIMIEEFASDEKNAIVDGPFGSNLKTIHYRASGVPVIQSGFVTSNKFIAEKYLYVDKEKFESEIRSKTVPGDIIMAKIGAQCGTCAILPKNHPVGILAGNSLKITVSKINSNEFLEAYLHFMHDTGVIYNIITTTAQPAVSMSSLKVLKIKYPEPKEQIEISKRLKTIDNKIVSEENYLIKLQQIKSGLMADLLSGNKLVSIPKKMETQTT